MPVCSGPTGDEGGKRRRGTKTRTRTRRTTQVTSKWEGVHEGTGDRLHLALRQDRSPIVVLFQAGNKHMLCAQINQCGATADWQ